MKKRTAFLIWSLVAWVLWLAAEEGSPLEVRATAMTFAGLAGWLASDEDAKL